MPTHNTLILLDFFGDQ